MVHEESFVRAFIVKSKQPRYLTKLASLKHRRDFLSRLHGGHLDYDPQYADHLPGSHTGAMIIESLRKLGAPTMCHAIGGEMDGTELPLDQAVQTIHAMGDGVVLSCIPGKLAYYEAGTTNGSYILKRQ
jgi:hypothetical protein